jgi:hypothetical protein
MKFLSAFWIMITYFTRWKERRRHKKAIEIRLAKILTLLLAIPLTTAMVHGQEVHYNYERGASISSYKTYQLVDSPTFALKADPAMIRGLPSFPR